MITMTGDVLDSSKSRTKDICSQSYLVTLVNL